ncbi:MAG TPA: aldo/keto reductase [Labilithrix sp.]|nr:aldo/keto reductase [Labilithrix sp.]
MPSLPRRSLGKTGLEISALGFGAGPLGDGRLTEHDADALVGAALDEGITLFDTAPSYGSSEERLGRALGARRREIVLATKGGYGVPGVPDWTGEVIRLGIEAALRRLRTDVIDCFILHSCDAETVLRDDVLGALDRAKAAGKIRAAGYSGENHALWTAIDSGRFDVVECSVSPFDRGCLGWAVPAATARGIGVLAKRPLANGAWRLEAAPDAPDLRTYWERARALAIDPSPLSWPELCVRFAAFADGVSCALVGTSSVTHLREAVRATERGPLGDGLRSRLDDAWKLHGSSWPGVI